MPEEVGTAQFTEMLDVKVRSDNFTAGLRDLEKAYDDFLNRVNKKGMSPQKVLDVNNIGQLNGQLKSLSASFTEARNAIVESLGGMAESLTTYMNALGGKVKITADGTTKTLNQMAEAADSTANKVEKLTNRFSKLSEMQSFQLYNQLKNDPDSLAGLNWKEQKTFDRLGTRFGNAASSSDRQVSRQAELDAKAAEKANQQQIKLNNNYLELLRNREVKEAEFRGKKLMADDRAADQSTKQQIRLNTEYLKQLRDREQKANEFLSMSAAQQRKIALGGGWSGKGKLLDPVWQKEADSMRSALQGVHASAGPIERFFSKMRSNMPEFIAQIIKYSIGFQLIFAAINAVQATLMAPINALKQGIVYLTAIQDRTADIKEALLENVKYSNDWVENTKKAATASEIATKKIMEVAAAAAIPPEKIEAGLKALIQGGGLKLMNGDLEQSVVLTAKLLSLMRSRGVSETNQRRAVTEINQLMNGQVKTSSVLLQVLGVSVPQWKKIREEAAKTHDLLGAHITATETVGDRLGAVDDRLANAQNRWKDLTATLEQYKNQLFGAFSEGMFNTLLGVLKNIKTYFDQNKTALMDMARLTGQSVANMAQLFVKATSLHDPLKAVALDISLAALAMEAMVNHSVAMIKLFTLPGKRSVTMFTDLYKVITGKESMGDYFNDTARKELGQIISDYKGQWSDMLRRFKELKDSYNAGPTVQSQVEQDIAANLAQQQSTRSLIENAKARKASAAELKKYTDELSRLQKINDVLVSQRNNVSVASGSSSPTILGYMDKPDSGNGVSNRLNLITEFDARFKDEIAAIRTAQNALRQQTETDVTERASSVEDGSRRIIRSYSDEFDAVNALIQKQRKALPELRQQMINRGADEKQLDAFDSKVRTYLEHLDTQQKEVRQQFETEQGKQLRRITKDRQEYEKLVADAQIASANRTAHGEIEASRRAAEQGYTDKSAALQKELAAEGIRHNGVMEALQTELREAGKNANDRLRILNKIAAEEDQYNDRRLAKQHEINEAAFEEFLTRRNTASELSSSYHNTLTGRVQRQEQRGQISSIQSSIEQRKILEDQLTAYKKERDAVLKASQVQNTTTAQGERLRSEFERLCSVIGDTEEQLRDLNGSTSSSSAFLRILTGKSESHNDEGTGAFDGFSNSVDTLNKGFQFFSQTVGNLINAWSQGTAQGGTLGGIGAVLGQAGSLVSMIPGGQLIGGIMSIGGGIASMIGGLFTAAARRIAEEIKKDLDSTMRDYSHKVISLSQAIKQVESERADAITRLSGKKGGKDELDKLLPEIDDELYSLKEQQKEILTNLDKELSVLRVHSDTLGEFITSWDDLNAKVKEYIDAGGDIAKASEYMSLSIEKLRESYSDELRDGEQQAIEDAISLNDLLKERVNLVNEWKKTEFDARTGTSEERRQVGAVRAGQELAQKYKDYRQQLDDLDKQISLATQKVDKEKQLFDISIDINELHRRDDELQLEALDKELSKYKDLKTLIESISNINGQWAVSQNLYDLLGLGSNSLSGLKTGGMTVNGGINVNVNVSSTNDAASIGKTVGQSIYSELSRAYSSGLSYA